MSDQSKQTTIAEGTVIDGSIRSEGQINLSGVLKGKLDALALTVAPTGKVQGKIKVGELRSSGEVSGEILAETAELGGRVADQTVIRAKNLQVKLSKEEGGVKVSFGNCELQVGEKPSQSGSKKQHGRQEQNARDQQQQKNAAEPVAKLVR